jgi:hypothetical protein
MQPPDHRLLDSSPNVGPLISRWEINKFENCWHKSVRILEVLKLLFQQFLNLSSSERDISGPRLGALCNNTWSGGTHRTYMRGWFIACLLSGSVLATIVYVYIYFLNPSYKSKLKRTWLPIFFSAYRCVRLQVESLAIFLVWDQKLQCACCQHQETK